MLIGLIALTAVLMVSLLWVRQALAPTHSQAPNQAAGVLGDLLRSRGELVAENALLRQQLIILRLRTKRPRFTRLDRLLVVLLARRVRAWRQALLIVRPDTLLRWHRAGFRLLWRRRSQARSSTRRLDPQVVALIQHLARENRLWGAERIRGELLKLGVRVCKRTIQKYILCRAETTIIVDPGA